MHAVHFCLDDIIRKQLEEGYVPSITYTNSDGEVIILSVYAVPSNENAPYDSTIWTFEKSR